MFATPRYNISDRDSESEVKELKKELAQLKSELFSCTSPTTSSFGLPLLQMVADILKHQHCVS